MSLIQNIGNLRQTIITLRQEWTDQRTRLLNIFIPVNERQQFANSATKAVVDEIIRQLNISDPEHSIDQNGNNVVTTVPPIIPETTVPPSGGTGTGTGTGHPGD